MSVFKEQRINIVKDMLLKYAIKKCHIARKKPNKRSLWGKV